MPARPNNEPPDGEAYDDPSGGAYYELQAGLPEREHARHHGGHGYPVGDDTRGVVDEALSFEDRHYEPWEAEAFSDGRG